MCPFPNSLLMYDFIEELNITPLYLKEKLQWEKLICLLFLCVCVEKMVCMLLETCQF